MTPEDQIKAIAELDGYTIEERGEGLTPHCRHKVKPLCGLNQLQYLTSRDAIVPVIEKQPKEVRLHIASMLILAEDDVTVFPSATQLSEALLRATGKWKD